MYDIFLSRYVKRYFLLRRLPIVNKVTMNVVMPIHYNFLAKTLPTNMYPENFRPTENSPAIYRVISGHSKALAIRIFFCKYQNFKKSTLLKM